MFDFSDDELETVGRSALFDARWYAAQYPDVMESRIEPARHYCWLGWRLGRDPGPDFSTSFYLRSHPDILRKGVNPLYHYEKHGQAEGRASRSSSIPGDESQGAAHHKNRVAIFASFSGSGRLEPYVKTYLRGLATVCEHIIFVADNDIGADDIAWLHANVSHNIIGRHGEYDFGSYKRGLQLAKAVGLLESAEQVILCNDSCYGPLSSLSHLFDTMDAREVDFWGITSNTQFKPHIQSYFVVFSQDVVSHPAFLSFFEAVKVEPDVSRVVLGYEVPMTAYFADLGFSWDTLINKDTPDYGRIVGDNLNISVRPQFMVASGSPFVKVKAFKKTNCNYDGVVRTFDAVRSLDPALADEILEHVDISTFLSAPNVAFSLIMPFLNRRETITTSIDSVMAQTHKRFELLLVDDGSTDGASEEIQHLYASEIRSGRIVLLRNDVRKGVSAARNLGLRTAKNPWIGYVDSDNFIDPHFLESFASAIVEMPQSSTFYCWHRRASDQRLCGRHYSRKDLINANFIDLGTFIHARRIYSSTGGFDESLKRLVDWDLIIRYTERYPPVCLPRPLMIYADDAEDASRITVSESLDDARLAIRKKFSMPLRVTTIIPTYNHADFIEKAVESAVAQRGAIQHEILVCDDGSTDGTSGIVALLAKKHPGLVKNISTQENLGISDTFRRCIAHAAGDVIAVLEGDDFWTDPEKLAKQAAFLLENPDCSMVFSKIIVKGASGAERTLDRQDRLSTNKLDGQDFLNEPTMNLIANFSSCMFKAGLLRVMPERLYQGRLNEIALAFHFERHGKLGFINEPMSVYRQHAAGVWTGSSKEQQLRSGLAAREMVRDVADPKYRDQIDRIIEEKYAGPLERLSAVPA